jgi:DNA-binding phage protein
MEDEKKLNLNLNDALERRYPGLPRNKQASALAHDARANTATIYKFLSGATPRIDLHVLGRILQALGVGVADVLHYE